MVGKLVVFYDFLIGFCYGLKLLVDDEMLVVVFVFSYFYICQYDFDLLVEFCCDNQVMCVIVIVVESSDIVVVGLYIILLLLCYFIDVEQVFCFLMYVQMFVLMQLLYMGNTLDILLVSGIVNCVV